MWEEMRQDTMRPTSKTVSASNGQEVFVVSVDSDDLDGDGVVTLLERTRSRKRTALAASGPVSGAVSTNLEDIGPNTYERIKNLAGRSYLAQAAGYESTADTANPSAGLFKNA